MKRSLVSLVCCLFLLWLSVPIASAGSNGLLYVTGSIKLATCSISGASDQDHATLSWLMPGVHTGNLYAEGMTAGRSQDSIHLDGANCNDGYIPSITISPGGNVSGTSGNLINTVSEGAKNVEVRLLMNDEVLDLRTNPRVACVPITNHESRCEIQHEYYATGPVTAGSVRSGVQFNITYD